MTNNAYDFNLSDLMQGHRSRLQQKMLNRGIDAFEDYELLELILTRAIPRRDVKPLAKTLMHHFGSLSSVLYADPYELMSFKGVKESVVCVFKLIVGTSQRLVHHDLKRGPILNHWDKLQDFCLLMFSAEQIEHFYVLYLDAHHKLIQAEEHQKGTLNHTPLYPREILKRALNLNSKGVIFDS